MRPFRFGIINERLLPAGEWVNRAQRAEELGYDTFLIRDHLLPDVFGYQHAPLVALAFAAGATERLRIGTLVLSNDFRHPAMLAKEAATLKVLSGGRFELGLGAGWLKSEYEAAGIRYDPASVRIDRLAEAIQVIRRTFGQEPATFEGTHYQLRDLDAAPKPAQQSGPPLLLGGGKRMMLQLAGREADIISLLTSSVSNGTLRPDPAEVTPDAVRQKIGWIREGAGVRFDEIELNMIPTMKITGDPERAASELIAARGWDEIALADVLEMPSIFLGPVDVIAEQMLRRREEYGISYYVVSDRQMDEVAPLIARLRSLSAAPA
ncbi:MAG: TIGR03621 family F420-dependent LLM class oxidoreductase [Chloroflexota bacterium]